VVDFLRALVFSEEFNMTPFPKIGILPNYLQRPFNFVWCHICNCIMLFFLCQVVFTYVVYIVHFLIYFSFIGGPNKYNIII
jgi:hypothetical protein